MPDQPAAGPLRRLPVAGGELGYLDVGAGPPIVLLHGFSFDLAMWDPQVPALARDARVVRYDLRGFGSSGPPSAGHGHVEDLLALLDGLGVERACLIGLSLGANVALAAAADHPDRVTALVLASPGLPGHRWSEERPPDAAAAVARERGVEEAKRFWLDHPLYDSTHRHPAARTALRAMVDRFPAHQWREGPAARPLPALADRLEGIGVPTLVLNGELDAAGYREIGRLLGERLPRGRHLEVPDAGHVLNLERPDVVNRAVLDFLSGPETQVPP